MLLQENQITKGKSDDPKQSDIPLEPWIGRAHSEHIGTCPEVTPVPVLVATLGEIGVANRRLGGASVFSKQKTNQANLIDQQMCVNINPIG